MTIAAHGATESFAVRTNQKANKERSIIHVVDRISSLLESRGMAKTEVMGSLHALALQGITPGAADSMNEILNRVIAEIEQKVETKIKAGHASTQTAINEKIADLEASTTEVVSEKKKADGLDVAWFQCIAAEKAKRVDIEEAEENLKKAQQAQVAPCKLQEDRRYFDTDPNADKYNFACSFNDGDDCDTRMKDWQAEVDELVSGTESGAQYATSQWTEAKNACNQAKADVAAAESALEAANAGWGKKKRDCLAAHESRVVAMCLFGAHLQRKCEMAAAYSNLIAEVNKKNGGEHSHPDRVSEWQGTAVAKCMLKQVAEGYEITSASLDACYQSVNFDRDVGVLDQKESTFADLTSPAKFTCKETTISFYGQTWEVPEGDAPHSSEYATKSFQPEVSVAVDTAPFAFCGGGDNGGKEVDSKHQLVDGCSRSGQTFSQYGAPREESGDQRAGEAICCTEDGEATRNVRNGEPLFNSRSDGRRTLSHNDCTSGRVVRRGEEPTMTFHEAEAFCAEAGLGLCRSQAEVDSSCHTGCHFDFAMVWLRA